MGKVMTKHSKIIATLGALAFFGSSATQPAYAADGIIRSTIVGVEPSGGGMAVYFNGFPVVCPAGARSGYILTSDPNYQTYVSVILTAMTTKTPVYVYSNISGGGCHIIVVTAGDTPLPP
jgi:hypothetical protein